MDKQLIEEFERLSPKMTEEEIKAVELALELHKPDLVDWIEEEFYIPETGIGMKLYPYQRKALEEARKVDEKGRFVYSTVLWNDIKKSAKTCISAAIALYTALYTERGRITVVGNDLRQSKSRAYGYITRAIYLNKDMAKKHKIRVFKTHIYVGKTKSEIRPIAVDPAGEAGAEGDDFVLITEAWGMKSEAHQKLWAELTLSPLKFGLAQRWIESYAGMVGESPVLENLYASIVGDIKPGEMPGDENKFMDDPPMYKDKSGTMIALCNHEPRLPWQTPAYYRQQEAEHTPADFNRMHRNVWASSINRLLGAGDGMLDGVLVGDIRPPMDKPVFLGVDAGVKRDTFGLVGVTYNEEYDLVEVVYERCWKAEIGGEVDLGEAEREIENLIGWMVITAVAFDPTQLLRTIQYLKSLNILPDDADGRSRFYEFSQGRKRVIADTSLLDRIRGNSIKMLEGGELEAHIKNSMAESDGKHIRIVKKKRGKPVDLAVALSMAVYVAVEGGYSVPGNISWDAPLPDRQHFYEADRRGYVPERLPGEVGMGRLPDNLY